MRYAKYIALLVAFFAVSACTIADIDENINVGTQHNSADNIQVVGRISRYSEYDVATRGAKTTEEGKVTSMALAIFKIGDKAATAVGSCEYFNYQEGGELLFTIDRKDKYTADAHYAMYVFANIADMEKFEAEIKERTIINDEGEEEIVYDYSAIILDDLKSVASEVSDIKVPESGFPMIGSLGDFVSEDGDRTMQGNPQYFILKPAGQPTPLPTVNDQAKDLLTIPMKAMYAKMNFSIIVTPDQTIEDKLPPQFQITGYEVYNVPSEVDFKKDTNSDSDVLGEPCVGVLLGVNDVAVGAGTIDFSFYVPERYFEPKTKSENYAYPFKGTYSDIADKDGNGIRDEDEKYMQRYKPMLVGDKKATYVKISGIYLDHQNKQFQVSYDIYLGKDNYSNFDVERNSEYNNYITIRGISTSADQTVGDQTISIDHRVNVTRLKPLTINLRRETLLDSHFEVRPLRIRKTKNYQSDVEGAIPVPTSVKVEVIYPKDEPTGWVGLELANSAISTAHLSSGKRKYFTTDLVTSTLKAKTDAGIEVPINEEQQTVWIYVDECTSVGDDVRSAIVRISYLDGNGNTIEEDFRINQRKLFEVFYDENNNNVKDANERTYYIEYHEEYLHNYDAEDTFGQTDQEGMQWGLDGMQISFEYRAVSFSWVQDLFSSGVRPFYDFYIEKYDSEENGTHHKYAGLSFSNKILGIINNEYINPQYNWLGRFTGYERTGFNTDASDDIETLTLDKEPRSAVEYCANKNKRNADGSLISSTDDDGLNASNVKWYMPAIDEMEDIVMSGYTKQVVDESGVATIIMDKAYSRFVDFRDKYYWSSQPAYLRNYYYYKGLITGSSEGNGYIDDVYSARATKVLYEGLGADGKPKYSIEESGVLPETYNTATSVYIATSGKSETITSGKFNHGNKQPTVGTTKKQSGHHFRTRYNRVRCVRKMD